MNDSQISEKAEKDGFVEVLQTIKKPYKIFIKGLDTIYTWPNGAFSCATGLGDMRCFFSWEDAVKSLKKLSE